MKKELILKEIFRQNSFWNVAKQPDFFEFTKYKRKLFYLLQDYIDKKQIVSIVGLRRTGKTVLLKQLIKQIIKNNPGIDLKNILFLSFDEALVADNLSLEDYLNAYLDNIRPDNKGKTYIFIDEVQYIEQWQHIIKRYYDTDSRIKFVIAGSSSLFLRKRTVESLAGRIFEFRLSTLDFLEFLELTEQDENFVSAYKKNSQNIKGQDLGEAKKNRLGIENFLAEYGNVAAGNFHTYLSFGQFPEAALEPYPDKAAKYLRESVYKKVIEYDIPRIFGVEKIGALEFIFEVFINETGNQIELQNIASEAGLSAKTLAEYVEFFHQSLLLDIVYNYSKSFRKSRRSAKKAYIASTNFYRLNEAANSGVRAQALGHLAETYAYNLLKINFEYVATYKDRAKEIDFVCSDNLQDNQNFYFVEVKYRESARERNFGFLQSTAKKLSGRPYFVFTKNEYFVDENGIGLPLYLAI